MVLPNSDLYLGKSKSRDVHEVNVSLVWWVFLKEAAYDLH